ncbi:TetR/AcrR family transcriptional regulator [Pseudoalteromonas sp. RW-H-Ap-1]|uniref:TetR/AcrR family transcriptional regulator n=1 Tax=Pseudoalteromonas sp. RW-H-Ap-1 TaxID=3241171 RepID=UPI00390CB30C
MANKVKFEREQVVRAASQLFWEKGFHATSTRDLQEAINMRPGSIYAAFGSKEGLYCEAIKNYAKQMQSLINERLVSCSSILDALQDFVEYVVISSKSNTPSAICMLVKANNEFIEKDSYLYQISVELMIDFEHYLTELFTLAIAAKELSGKIAAIDYARFFQIQFTGLRNYFNRPNVEHLAEPMIENMFSLMKSL